MKGMTILDDGVSQEIPEPAGWVPHPSVSVCVRVVNHGLNANGPQDRVQRAPVSLGPPKIDGEESNEKG